MVQINPLGAALVAYHSGRQDADFIITRNDGFEQKVAAEIFFDDIRFPEIELRALQLCRGDILDVGAAVGRHSLALHRRELKVWSLDILPQAVQIMSERGLPYPIHGNILKWAERSFDTVLMLMNGIGVVGVPEELDRFLHHAHRLVAPCGQILCDSIDVSVATNPIHVLYREENVRRGLYPGQQFFTIAHDNLSGGSFPWLHVDFASLAEHCSKAGWNCTLLNQEEDGHYLAMITRKGDKLAFH